MPLGRLCLPMWPTCEEPAPRRTRASRTMAERDLPLHFNQGERSPQHARTQPQPIQDVMPDPRESGLTPTRGQDMASNEHVPYPTPNTSVHDRRILPDFKICAWGRQGAQRRPHWLRPLQAPTCSGDPMGFGTVMGCGDSIALWAVATQQRPRVGAHRGPELVAEMGGLQYGGGEGA